jgi:hypothetical protein
MHHNTLPKCSGRHRKAIEELGTSWDGATQSVIGFSEDLTADMTKYTEAASTMMLDSVATSKLKGDAATQWAAATTAFKAATTDAYTPAQAELNDFVSMWTEKSTALTTLKDGLAAGKIEGDVVAQIAELSALVTQANEKVAAWVGKKTELSSAADAALESLKKAYEMVAPKK